MTNHRARPGTPESTSGIEACPIQPRDRVHTLLGRRPGRVLELDERTGIVLCLLAWDDGASDVLAPWHLDTDTGIPRDVMADWTNHQRATATELLLELHSEARRIAEVVLAKMTELSDVLGEGGLPGSQLRAFCDGGELLDTEIGHLGHYRALLIRTGLLTADQQHHLLTTT